MVKVINLQSSDDQDQMNSTIPLTEEVINPNYHLIYRILIIKRINFNLPGLSFELLKTAVQKTNILSFLGISVNLELVDVRTVSGDFSKDLLDVGHRLPLSLSSRLALVGQKYQGLRAGNVLHHFTVGLIKLFYSV